MSKSHCVATLVIFLSTAASARAQRTPFVGAVTGISTLSADARSVITDGGADVSLYKPENGPALNLLAGLHVNDYFSVQANYIWNRNTLTLSSVHSANAEFFEERRRGVQHGFIADGLLYFRSRESWVRPYLSAGVGLVRFESGEPTLLASSGAPTRPRALFTSTDPALRVAVGIDLGSDERWRFRYSFSETISSNPVSAQLSPPAQRNLANFQNLFGVIRSF
jgi:Outer membrane protein beta-barrel domain